MSFPRFVETDTHSLRRLLGNVAAIVNVHGRTRINGKTASERTFRQTQEVMATFCRRLHRLGYFLEDVSSLREKHIRAVVRSWWEDRMSPKTMQNQYSRLKIFCSWINKRDIINHQRKGVAFYIPEAHPEVFTVKTVAENSRSWSGNGLDIQKIVEKALAQDYRHGVMLSMGLAFGLRKKEMLLLKPWKADKSEYLEISDNVAKNGRYRTIPIEKGDMGKAQRRALTLAKEMCKRHEHMGWPGLTLKQSENRYYYRMSQLGLTKAELGVTGHGARAEYAELALLLEGVVPPTLGGNAADVPRLKREAAIQKVAEALGHNDNHTSSAYYGSFAKPQTMNRLGGRVGPTIVLEASSQLTATIWCNPAPRPAEDGTIRVPRSSIKKVCLIAVVEGGAEVEEMPIDALMKRWPHTQMHVESQLNSSGLTTVIPALLTQPS